MHPTSEPQKAADSIEDIDLEEELSRHDVATKPNETADPDSAVREALPADVVGKFEIVSYRSAAFILSRVRTREFDEIIQTLRNLKITREMLLKPGGNESPIPKLFSAALRPMGWHETVISGDLTIHRTWRTDIAVGKKGQPLRNSRSVKHRESIVREKFLDGHKVDYVKDRVAFDLEWNSKDQTFDRDLYAFSAFSHCGIVDAGVLVTRSESLNGVFRQLGIMNKYGASTTWMGKLIYRLNAGRNGGCPVLAIGITPNSVDE